MLLSNICSLFSYSNNSIRGLWMLWPTCVLCSPVVCIITCLLWGCFQIFPLLPLFLPFPDNLPSTPPLRKPQWSHSVFIFQNEVTTWLGAHSSLYHSLKCRLWIMRARAVQDSLWIGMLQSWTTPPHFPTSSNSSVFNFRMSFLLPTWPTSFFHRDTIGG